MKSPTPRFAEKTAIVTGGAQGIGYAIAQQLAREGANVVIADIDCELATTSAAEISAAAGAVVAGVQTDVSQRVEVNRVVELAQERFGRLDHMFAHAGIAAFEPFLTMSDDLWEKIMGINLTGVFYCLQEAGRAMASSGGGTMVVTSSVNSFFVEQGMAAYNTSKGGVANLVRSAAIDLAGAGIRVNAVAPGTVRTRIATWVTDDPVLGPQYLKDIPAGRFAEPVDVARTALFLASDESDYVTGQQLILDGGLTLGVPLDVEAAEIPQ